MANISSDVIESFVAEAQELLEAIRKDIITFRSDIKSQVALQSILRNLHTIKGNSRMLGFNRIEQISHAIEDVFKSIKDEKIKMSDTILQLVFYVSERISDCLDNIRTHNNDNINIDIYIKFCDQVAVGEIINIDDFASEIKNLRKEQLINDAEEDEDDDIGNLQSIRIKIERVDEMISSVDDMITREFRLKHQLDKLKEEEERTGSHELSKIRKQFATDISALENAIFDIQQQVFDLRMLPIRSVIRPFETTIVMEAISMNKKIKPDIPDTEIGVDKVILEQLNDVLMHLVRNALDHGIETPEVREAKGKNPEGTISILCDRKSNNIEIIVKDDGQGINFDKIREKALVLYPERTDEIIKMGEKELTSFLYVPGFSTREEVTAISGRGVGLDVVRTNIEKIKGRIHVETEKDKGTSFILTIPTSLATLQGLFIKSNGDKYLLSSQYLIDIVYRRRDEYITLQNQTYIKIQDHLIPIFSLSSLFRDQKTSKPSMADNIIIAEYMEQQIGIVVDEVLQYISLVVKPLPKAFKNTSILQGIVFDEHYDIVPILNVPDIITKFKSMRGYDIKKAEAKSKAPVYRILLVDDSKTTQQVEKGILEGGGYIVDTACDGIDALSKLKLKHYDLVVSDKDMPRMNGLVLVDNLRLMENYTNTPVIIISADNAEEKKAAFEKAGANSFISKEDFKRGTLIMKVKELLHE